MIVHNKHNARYIAHHAQDVFTDLGYDYRQTIFKKTISKVILENKISNAILTEVQKMFVYLIDTVKQIRLQYMISLDKNDRNLN
jgi:hypothetical protein